MTKEEKIICKAYLNDLDRTHDCNEYKLLMKLLDQEPCEDCVSRRKVEKLKKWRFSYDNNTTIPKSDIFVKLTDIRTLPPVTPKRKKWKWIRHEERKPLKYGYELIIKGKCSNCGEVFGETYKMNFCPNCGAEMIKE